MIFEKHVLLKQKNMLNFSRSSRARARPIWACFGLISHDSGPKHGFLWAHMGPARALEELEALKMHFFK